MAWRVFAAAAIGKSHIDAGTPCQDAYANRVVGEVVVACVCDGAGSQPLSHEGAQFASRDIVERLAGLLEADPHWIGADADALCSAIAAAVAETRSALQARAVAEAVPFASFSATLVGAVSAPDRGCFFHVGDGVCVASSGDPVQADVVSVPENGEYANETYFITGDEWREHLRVETFSQPVSALALMSDGAAPFVMAKGNAGLFRPFMEPVVRFLDTVDEAAGSAALAATLEDPRTYGITGDDKCLLVALWR